ncbi:MAG: anhydro-N-acetylmuramic acid kinase [Crocinitomicaceae bacterium]
MDSKTRFIGLMSGTSLDGLDLCCVDFLSQKNELIYDIVATRAVPYDAGFKKELKEAINFQELQVSRLSVDFAKFMANQVNVFIQDNHLEDSVDYIASHGHTVFHQPQKGITIQVGDGQVLADLTKISVVNDFRVGDVKLGGQGAPLVPIGDRLLFHEYESCLNLGGISNLSFEKNGERIAFDIGPANIPLNYLMMDEAGKDYDENGQLAKSGQVIQAMLRDLNRLSYYNDPIPKSLGIEWMRSDLFPIIQKYQSESLADRLATIVEHEAIQIAEVLNKNELRNVLITGGGVFNSYLLERIALYSNASIEVPEKQVVEFKEALIFALLGYLRVFNQINVLSSVTGATKDSCAGIIHTPSIK